MYNKRPILYFAEGPRLRRYYYGPRTTEILGITERRPPSSPLGPFGLERPEREGRT